VLVTRPAAQAERLCSLIEAAGGEAVRLPAIEIRGPADPGPLDAVVAALDSYDLAVFISVNAVNRGLDFILSRRAWPAGTLVATVGVSSAAAVAQHGLKVDLLPEHSFNSEALLALDELQDMTGKRVVIFRGNGGRELLRDALVSRGASVDYVAVYQRVCPEVAAETMQQLLQPGFLACITITSNETLENLYTMAGPRGQPLLREIPLVVVGERQAALAARLGFTQLPVIAGNAGDAALLAAVTENFLSGRGAPTGPG
jgi:uroporphyrinogen-III synthase